MIKSLSVNDFMGQSNIQKVTPRAAFHIGGFDKITQTIWVLGGSGTFAIYDPGNPPHWTPINNLYSFDVTDPLMPVLTTHASLTSPVMGVNGFFERETDRTIYYSSLNNPYIGTFNMGTQAQNDQSITLPNNNLVQYCAAINNDDESYFIIAGGSPIDLWDPAKYDNAYIYYFGSSMWDNLLPLNLARTGHRCIIVNNTLFAVSGYYRSQPLDYPVQSLNDEVAPKTGSIETLSLIGNIKLNPWEYFPSIYLIYIIYIYMILYGYIFKNVYYIIQII